MPQISLSKWHCDKKSHNNVNSVYLCCQPSCMYFVCCQLHSRCVFILMRACRWIRDSCQCVNLWFPLMSSFSPHNIILAMCFPLCHTLHASRHGRKGLLILDFHVDESPCKKNKKTKVSFQVVKIVYCIQSLIVCHWIHSAAPGLKFGERKYNTTSCRVTFITELNFCKYPCRIHPNKYLSSMQRCITYEDINLEREGMQNSEKKNLAKTFVHSGKKEEKVRRNWNHQSRFYLWPLQLKKKKNI